MAGLDDLFTDCGSLANGVTVRGERIRRKVKDIGPISVRLGVRLRSTTRLEIGDLVPDLFFLLVPLSEDLADQMYEGDRDGGGEKAPLNWRMAFHLPEARVAARAGAGATRVGGDYVGCGVGRLMNHSCKPNVKWGQGTIREILPGGVLRVRLKVLQPIEPGEEFLVDYGKEYFGSSNETCRCPHTHLHSKSSSNSSADDAPTFKAEKLRPLPTIDRVQGLPEDEFIIDIEEDVDDDKACDIEWLDTIHVLEQTGPRRTKVKIEKIPDVVVKEEAWEVTKKTSVAGRVREPSSSPDATPSRESSPATDGRAIPERLPSLISCSPGNEGRPLSRADWTPKPPRIHHSSFLEKIAPQATTPRPKGNTSTPTSDSGHRPSQPVPPPSTARSAPLPPGETPARTSSSNTPTPAVPIIKKDLSRAKPLRPKGNSTTPIPEKTPRPSQPRPPTMPAQSAAEIAARRASSSTLTTTVPLTSGAPVAERLTIVKSKTPSQSTPSTTSTAQPRVDRIRDPAAKSSKPEAESSASRSPAKLAIAKCTPTAATSLPDSRSPARTVAGPKTVSSGPDKPSAVQPATELPRRSNTGSRPAVSQRPAATPLARRPAEQALSEDMTTSKKGISSDSHAKSDLVDPLPAPSPKIQNTPQKAREPSRLILQGAQVPPNQPVPQAKKAEPPIPKSTTPPRTSSHTSFAFAKYAYLPTDSDTEQSAATASPPLSAPSLSLASTYTGSPPPTTPNEAGKRYASVERTRDDSRPPKIKRRCASPNDTPADTIPTHDSKFGIADDTVDAVEDPETLARQKKEEMKRLARIVLHMGKAVIDKTTAGTEQDPVNIDDSDEEDIPGEQDLSTAELPSVG